MNTTIAEKEWLQRLTVGNNAMEKKEEKPVPKADMKDTGKATAHRKGNGFGDVAGMDDLKKLVTESFINVLKNRDCAEAFGIKPPNMLLYGPPGCGKTFFAEKMAEELGINFMKVVPDEIASIYAHGTQEKIGALFRKAEQKAPTLLFCDEFDAMVPHRSNDDHSYQNGEVNEFLCMLNNAADRGIYVIAATNHPERIDKAVLRTGRIDELIYVDMPDIRARESLFRLFLSQRPSEADIDLHKLAALTEGYNCSDISYMVKVASRRMFNESIMERDKPYKRISQNLLEEVISQKSPSVSNRDIKEFERQRYEFSPKDKECKRMTIGFR